MTWRELPFVRLIIPFILGISTAIFGQVIPHTLANSLFIVSFLIVLLFQLIKTSSFLWRWVLGTPLSITLFLMGYISTVYKNELNQEAHFSTEISLKKECYIIGVVTDKTEKTNYHRLTVSVKKTGHVVDSLRESSGNLLVYVKNDTSSHTSFPLQYGDLVILNAEIQAIEAPKNPYAVDFQQYWHFQNIHYQAFIDSSDLKVLGSDYGNPIIALAQRWQSYFIYSLKQVLGEGQEWVVGSALLLGSKEAISDDIRNAYIESGAMHILAISGMHILLIFNLFEKFLNLYKSGNRRWRWMKTGILISIILLFTLLVGLGTSVLRAAVMASFVAIGKAMRRQVNIYNILAVSAFALLLWNPYWLMDIGFQLSYTAVVGIAFFTDKFQKLFIFENKLFNKIWSNISIGLAAQLMVTPLALYYFHQFPTWFWLTGLLVGIIADGALIAGILFFVFNKIPVVNFILGKILFCFLWLMNNLVFTIQKLPFNLIDGISMSLWVVILGYVTIFGIVHAIEKRKLKLLYYPLSIITFLCAFYAFNSLKNEDSRYIIVYHIPGFSVVDVTDGQTFYQFSKKFSNNFNLENKIKFAATNLRNALRINNLLTFDFNEYYKSKTVIYHNGCMQIDTLKVLLLDKMPKKGLPLFCNYIIIRGTPLLDIHNLTQMFSFQQIIFDTSNKKWVVEKWKKECEVLNINYYDVGEKGAWVQKF
jgi:competence protein ComEC